MTTIGHFERALGRVALWAPRIGASDATGASRSRLRAAAAHLSARAARARTPTTARTRRRCCSATSRPAPTAATRCPAAWSSPPVARHRRARDDARAARRAAPRASTSRPTPTCWRSTKPSPTSSRCSSTSRSASVLRDEIAHTRGDLRTREPARRSWRSSSARRPAAAARCAMRSASDDRGGGAERARPRRLQQHRAACARRGTGRGGVRGVPRDLSQRAAPTYAARDRRHRRCCPTGEHPPRPRRRGWRGGGKTAGHVLQHVHPRARLLPAGRHHVRRYLRALVTADRDLVPDDNARLPRRLHRRIPPSAASARSNVKSLVGRQPWCWEDATGRPACWTRSARTLGDLTGGWQFNSDRLAAWTANAAALHRALMQRAGPRPGAGGARPAAAARGRGKLAAGRWMAPMARSRGWRCIRCAPLRRVGPDGQILSAVVIEITQRWRPSVPRARPSRRWCAAAAPSSADPGPGGALHRVQAGRPTPAGRAAGAAPGADQIRLDLRQLPAPRTRRQEPFALMHSKRRRPAMAVRKPARPPRAGRAPRRPPRRSRRWPEGPTKAAPAQAAPQVQIRMYRLGIGDCFLAQPAAAGRHALPHAGRLRHPCGRAGRRRSYPRRGAGHRSRPSAAASTSWSARTSTGTTSPASCTRRPVRRRRRRAVVRLDRGPGRPAGAQPGRVGSSASPRSGTRCGTWREHQAYGAPPRQRRPAARLGRGRSASSARARASAPRQARRPRRCAGCSRPAARSPTRAGRAALRSPPATPGASSSLAHRGTRDLIEEPIRGAGRRGISPWCEPRWCGGQLRPATVNRRRTSPPFDTPLALPSSDWRPRAVRTVAVLSTTGTGRMRKDRLD